MFNEISDDALKRLFPFKSFRAGQWDAIKDTAKALETHDNVLLAAPTGVGKGGIAVTLARAYDRSLITSPLVELVNQYEQTKEFDEYIYTLTGRSNYQCGRFLIGDCSQRLCQIQSQRTGQTLSCEYDFKLREARESPVLNCTLDLLLARPDLGNRNLLVVDEAHRMDDVLQRAFTVSIREDVAPDPGYAKAEDFRPWLKGLQRQLSKDVEEQERIIAEDDGFDAAHLRKSVIMRGTYERVSTLLDTRVRWLIKREVEGSVKSVTFCPVEMRKLMLLKVFPLAKKRIFMSATPPLAEEFGIDAAIVDVSGQAAFPPERRPVAIDVLGPMGYKTRNDYVGAIASKIFMIARAKTICHISSYSFAGLISAELDRMGIEHILQDRRAREASLDEWKRSKTRIFLAVAMTDGVDLPDDLCRYIVIVNVPFPNPSDPLIQERVKYEGKTFYNAKAARAVVQGCGRAMRSEKDFALSTILDANFTRVLWHGKEKEKYFPKWFRDAVIVKNSKYVKTPRASPYAP